MTTIGVSGRDWDEVVAAVRERAAAQPGEERIVVNMGPQHPSTHGVLRLILELDAETVDEVERENESVGRSQEDEVFDPDSDDDGERRGAAELAELAELVPLVEPASERAARWRERGDDS